MATKIRKKDDLDTIYTVLSSSPNGYYTSYYDKKAKKYMPALISFRDAVIVQSTDT